MCHDFRRLERLQSEFEIKKVLQDMEQNMRYLSMGFAGFCPECGAVRTFKEMKTLDAIFGGAGIPSSQPCLKCCIKKADRGQP